MYTIIESYIKKMTKSDVNTFAFKNDIMLSEEELNFTYDFIKKNYNAILKSNGFNIERYASYYSKENFPKVKKLFSDYFQKYRAYL